MARPRAPWWMIVLAASYVTTLGLEYYCDYFGVEPPGIRGEFSGQGMLMRTVAANSPAEGQGLRPGDLLVAMDGQPVRNQGDWIALCANLEVGRAHQWQIERAGRPRHDFGLNTDGSWREVLTSGAEICISLRRSTQRALPVARGRAWPSAGPLSILCFIGGPK